MHPSNSESPVVPPLRVLVRVDRSPNLVRNRSDRDKREIVCDRR